MLSRLLLVSAALLCAHASATSVHVRITHSTAVAKIDPISWTVGLIDDGADAIHCGGTLYQRNVVLTSAQCVGFSRPMYAIVGSTKLDPKKPTGERIRVINSWTYISTDAKLGGDYDVAVLELEKDVSAKHKLIQLADPDGSQDESGTTGVIRGWGGTSAANTTSRSFELREATVKIHSDDDCAKVYKKSHMSSAMTPRMLCAGGDDGKGITTGDMGGGLVVGNVLVGIAFYTELGNSGANPDFYTRVSNEEIHDFITETAELAASE